MDKYVKNVPSGYYSDGSSDNEHDFIYSDETEFIYNLKKHPKDIPDIGYRAGINGQHFNIKLAENLQEIFDEISKMWHGSGKKSPELLKKIQDALSTSDNPFVSTLQFFGNADEPPKQESLSYAILEAMNELKKTMKPSDVEESLDENTKFVAFHFMHDKNLTAIKKTIEVFQLVDSKQIFVNYIRRLIDRRDFKNAGSIACELQLFRDFGVDDLLIPLFLTDKMMILESYLKNAAHLQAEFVMFLDSLLTPESSVYEKCEELMKKYFITKASPTKMNEKPVNTLIERLVTSFKLAVKEVAPLHCRFKLSKKLGFAVRNHYEDKKSSSEAFHDQLNHLHIENDKDLQVELLERLMMHCKFKDAEKFAEQLKVPREKLPADLNEYIENGTVRKKTKISEKTEGEVEDRQDGPTGWSDDNSEVEDEFYELKLSPLMIDTIESYNQMIEELKTVKRIAFDIENTTSGSVAVLQISTSDKVFIVDVLGLKKLLDEESWKKLGCEIFNNAEVVKLGFGILPDIQMLQKIPEISIETPLDKSYRDLKIIGLNVLKLLKFKYPHHEENLTNLSLTKLAKLCFGKKLDKRNQLSNWSLRPLRPEQITYAAIDAFVLIEIHNVILGILKELKIAEDEMEKFFFE